MIQSQKRFRQLRLVFTTLILLSAFSTKATEIIVSSKTALNTAISAARPGDIITMSDGTWTNTTINLTKAGNSTAPITLRAKTPGKVVLNGTSTLTFSAAYCVVSGLNFNQGALSSGQVVIFSSTNCRLTNSAIINYNPELSTTPYYWIFFSGSYNRVDHCLFEGKNHQQPVVGNDFADSRYNRFDNNYVYNIPYIPGVNGREIMRLWGYGRDEETGNDGAFFTVENNLFEKADGEGAEIVSLKSSRNIVRYNTVLASKGSINIRGGKYNTVHGNFILGQNAPGAYGIRASNQYQTITNNYIADCQSGINIHVGEYIDGYLTPEYTPIPREGAPLGRVPVYTQMINSTIAFNTVVNVSGLDLELGSAYKGYWPTQQRVLIPENNKIANNLFIKMNGKTSVSSPTVDTNPPLDIFTFTPNTYEGNIVYGGAIDLNPMPSSGFSTQNPLVSLDSDGIYRIAANSPAINAAAGIYNDITDDMDGQPRIGTKDIGADEYSTSAKIRKPLTSNDVGPDWLGLEAPSDLTAVVSSGNQIDLSWKDNTVREDSYIIERSLDGSIWSTLTTTAANTTSYSDTGLAILTKYYYRVKAVNSNESTAYSNTASATTSCSLINSALNKTATASATWSTTYAASKSVDGDPTTRWASAGGATTATLDVNLGGSYTFSQVVIKEYSSRISSYKIQYWNGATWLDAYTGTTIGEAAEPVNFPAVTGTMVRLNILAAGSEPSIWEFTVNDENCSISGINNIAESNSHTLNQLVAYPNPVKNNLTISYPLPLSGLTTLDIYNISGSKIKSIVSENVTTGKFKAEINIDELPNGFYIVKLTNRNNIKCVKISVER